MPVMAPVESPPLLVTLADEAATGRLAAAFARAARLGDVLALAGPLGAGKTAFARAFIQALPGGEAVTEIPSPTFTLAQVYALPAATVWHFDFYRLEDPEEVWELGWEEAVGEGIVLVEWPERAGTHLPADRFDVALAMAPEPGARIASLAAPAGGARAARLSALVAGLEGPA